MEVSARNAKIWRKDFKTRNGEEFYRYSVSVSRKMQDGRFVSAYIPVVFSKKADAPDVIDNGAVCNFSGFMSVDSYPDRDGNTKNTPQIVIMKVEFEDPTVGVDSFEKAEEEIPF